MTPPWREKAKRSQGQRRMQNFNPIPVPNRFLSQITQQPTNPHQSDSDRCMSKYDSKIVIHTTENAEICDGTHLRAICKVISNVFEHSIYFGGALCGTPPRDLHSFYKCLWTSDMFSFNFLWQKR